MNKVQQAYRQTLRGKLLHNKSNKEWEKRNPERAKEVRKKAQKKYNKTGKRKLSTDKYYQSEKGKEYLKRKYRKHFAKRKRNLNWILMFSNPFDSSILVEYHHITDTYVVAIPKDLHQLYSGKNHRENTMEIAKQIYLGGK